MTWIRTIPRGEATGTLQAAYDWQAKRLGEPTEYTQLGSLYPELVMLRLHLYKTVEGCPSGLSPIERQLAALVTSELNATPHCSSGLHLKLLSLGADRELLRQVGADPRTARSGIPRLDAIIEHAVKLTLHPGDVDESDIDRLRAHGLEDLDILDLNNMVAYYCYTNRVANGLGLKTPIGSAREATLALPV
ncbi:MAG TPA: peroxidase-related enzyme [Chloroflexota bacterium]|nr:peroxidase-related enzyme [Chloroflexota bacterium]